MFSNGILPITKTEILLYIYIFADFKHFPLLFRQLFFFTVVNLQILVSAFV